MAGSIGQYAASKARWKTESREDGRDRDFIQRNMILRFS
jgi:hypothetical protein